MKAIIQISMYLLLVGLLFLSMLLANNGLTLPDQLMPAHVVFLVGLVFFALVLVLEQQFIIKETPDGHPAHTWPLGT